MTTFLLTLLASCCGGFLGVVAADRFLIWWDSHPRHKG